MSATPREITIRLAPSGDTLTATLCVAFAFVAPHPFYLCIRPCTCMYVCTRARTRVCIRGGMVMGSAIRSIYGPIRAHELAIPNMPRGTVDRVREKEERKKGNDEIKSNQLRPSRIECPLVLSLSLVVSFFVFSLCVRARARSISRSPEPSQHKSTHE